MRNSGSCTAMKWSLQSCHSRSLALFKLVKKKKKKKKRWTPCAAASFASHTPPPDKFLFFSFLFIQERLATGQQATKNNKTNYEVMQVAKETDKQ